MIVADTNLVVYLHLPGPHSDLAERVRQADPCWVAPELWRSELRNVLVTCMRRGGLSLEEALGLAVRAEECVATAPIGTSSRRVLELAARSGCTAYDCEFVAMAEALGVPLVTCDQGILRSFPETALKMEHFLGRSTGSNHDSAFA